MRSVLFVGTAIAGLVLAACRKTVTEYVFPASLSMAPDDTTIPQRGSMQLRVTVLDTAGRPISGAGVEFSSSDTTIAKVSTAGRVTSQGPLGAALVLAKLGTLQDVAVISVIDSSIATRLPLGGAPAGAAISPSGVVYVARAYANALERLDVPSRTFTASLGVGAIPTRVAFDLLGGTAYVSNQFSHDVSVVDVVSNTLATTVPVPGDPVPVRVSANGEWLYVATNVNRLYKVNLETKQRTDSIGLPATSHFSLLHPNDTLLYVATRAGGTVLEINVWTWTVLRTFALGGLTQGMVLSPNRQELYVANQALSRVDVINLATGSGAGSVPLGGGGFGLALSADGARLYVSVPEAGQVQIINRTGRSVLKTISVTGLPREIVVHAPSGLAVVPNEAGWVDLLR